MSKVSRTVLKNLVKECLVEILAEGLVGANKTIQESKVNKKRTPPKKKRTPRSVEVAQPIPGTIREITEDPILQSIFADTAKTTLVEQTKADNNSRVIGNDRISQAVDAAEPSELFGEAANNWAALAFAEKKRPGQHK